MRVLFVTSEFADFAKAGGLADVSAALPRALREQGVDVRVLLPAYQKVIDNAGTIKVVASLPRRGEIEPCLLGETETSGGLRIYLLLSPSLYQREGGAYGNGSGDFPDNDLRFARLSLAAAEIARGIDALGWRPDLVHAHDWPAGLAAGYMKWDNIQTPSVMTIHNLAHQGLFPAERRDALGIPEAAMTINGLEFHGQISFLKSGLFYADHVTTVSPTYAKEITTEERGGGLHGLLGGIASEARLTGIVNGIGDDWDDPVGDPHLVAGFDHNDPAGKLQNRDEVRTSLCLAPSDGPLFGVVSRLVHQKGMDLLAEVAPEIVRRGGQIAILGIGDPETEELLHAVVRNHRDHIALLSGFNEPMAHRIMAGSDFYLMPSRFEPCGLSQLHAQRYGSLPVAHATGGLVDTIEDGETGFLFGEFTAESFIGAIERAFAVYATPPELLRMRRAAMVRPVPWSEPAAAHVKLYARLTGKPVLRLARRRDMQVPAASALSPDLRAASVMSIL